MSTKSKTINKNIPMINVSLNYSSIKDEVEKAVKDVLSSGNYILGPNVELFEKELAIYLNSKHVISCANGTDAIALALMSLGVKAPDEVITVSNSYFATSEAIALVGAKPVFVDIKESDFNIDVAKIESLITKKTKAIIPVHLYGQPCDIDTVIDIAKKHGLCVIEDCAQAIGAKYKGKTVGTFGDIGTTSFYPTKNLGACGDGGAVFTNDENIAGKIKQLRTHGSLKRYVHDYIGLNSRLDEIQAAILRIKLKHLDHWNTNRQNAAKYYDSLLKNTDDVITPKIKSNYTHIFHQYTIRVKRIKNRDRDALSKKLKDSGIDTLIYYPIPIHMQKAFSYLEKTKLPITEMISKEILSLPMFPEITKEEQEQVISSLKEVIISSQKINQLS